MKHADKKYYEREDERSKKHKAGNNEKKSKEQIRYAVIAIRFDMCIK